MAKLCDRVITVISAEESLTSFKQKNRMMARLYMICYCLICWWCGFCLACLIDARALEAFHMECQRQLLQIKWHQFISNDAISTTTGLLSISETISRRHNALFDRKCICNFLLVCHSNYGPILHLFRDIANCYMARLPDAVPAHK